MLSLRLEYEYMKDEIDSAIRRCLEHQHWIFGPEVGQLEDTISSYLGVKHCIGVSSGTEALVLSLRALSIKTKGKEYFDRSDGIITTPLTFTATADAILRAGATPVFIDIDPDTYNIDPVKIREYLNSHDGGSASGNVVGIIPVHLYGRPCDMDEIMGIAQTYNLFVVEDAAQAFGGMWDNKKLGSLGTCGAFSFFPSKNLGGFGDGGMVSTNDDEIADIIRMLLKHGGTDKYNAKHIGYNARIDTLQAAVVLAKFKYIDTLNEKRRAIAQLYNAALYDLSCLTLSAAKLSAENGDYHVYNQYTIMVKDGKRDQLQAYLKKNNISSMVYYPRPLHRMEVFKNFAAEAFSIPIHAEDACDSVLSLPIEPLQRQEDTLYIAEQARKFDTYISTINP
ncbi:DegT/DnrJ/EryC1/StrS family aminotransferase [Candidatus Magnetominusculus xianensis]|nr:DegT/DnrJ/EryC1/StrS family aminotransferase [Candidatus Magnetominusculus xianensis]